MDRCRYLQERACNQLADKTYVIIFTPRSGSTWVASVLSSTDRLGYPDEYLNPEFVKQSALATNTRDPRELIDMLRRVRKTGNGVFGLKVRAVDVQLLGEADFFDSMPSASRYFLLLRKNIIAQGISLYRATATSWFHSTGNYTAPPAYDRTAIHSWVNDLLGNEKANIMLLQRHAIKPSAVLYYEDLIGDRIDVIQRFARELEVAVPDGVLRNVARDPQKIGDRWNEESERQFRHDEHTFAEEIELQRSHILRL